MKVSTTLLFITVCIAYVSAGSTCGGNCPSGTCTECYCGTSTEYPDLSYHCGRYSGWSQSCCECIAKHESGGNSHAELHNTNGSTDVGLW